MDAAPGGTADGDFETSRVLQREIGAAERIPYAAHVAPSIVRTAFGDYVQVFRLGGASFESSDDDELNNWHERLNVLWRNIASPNVALWTHLIRHRARIDAAPAPAGQAEGFFADACTVNITIVSLMKR